MYHYEQIKIYNSHYNLFCPFRMRKTEIPDAPNFDKTEILLVNA